MTKLNLGVIRPFSRKVIEKYLELFQNSFSEIVLEVSTVAVESQSPDMNRIENLCCELKQAIAAC